MRIDPAGVPVVGEWETKDLTPKGLWVGDE